MSRWDITTALLEWSELVGVENVVRDRQALDKARQSTFQSEHLIPAIVRPSSTEEVAGCVRIANRHQVPVYPVSSGKNWGYGSRLPAAREAVMLDLGRMNRVLEYSEDLAYVTVEPGVTYRQLYAYLKERNSNLWLDATGSSPDCSLVGNSVERGFGHTPYGDHLAQTCGFQVVLPLGQIIETGMRSFEGAHTGPVYRWGLGPSLDALFSQSNFGIVTRMTIWLMPGPEYFQGFFFRSDEAEGLRAIVEALRPLRLDNTLRSTVHIGNDYKVLSGIRQYPWAEALDQVPLPQSVLADMRKRHQFGFWNGSGGLYGTRAQVKEARRRVRIALRGKVSKLQFLDERLFGLASRFAKPYQWLTGWDLSRTLELARPVFDLMRGVPSDDTLKSAYWRKRMVAPEIGDPDRDRCGLLWCSPVVPMTGEHAWRVSEIATRILLESGFEPMLSYSMVNDRSLACVISITYDRERSGEDARASDCHHQLLAELVSMGYPPYRLGVLAMGELPDRGEYEATLQKLKAALDPNHTLAPDRYLARPRPVSGSASSDTMTQR